MMTGGWVWFLVIALCSHRIVNGFSSNFRNRPNVGPLLAMVATISALEQPKPFLNTLLSSRSSSEQKQKLWKEYQTLRSSDTNSSVAFLDSVLNEIYEKKNVLPFPFPKFLPSYRVKIAALKRSMDIFLEEEGNTDLSPSKANDEFARKRRALSVILNQLQSQNGIRTLEAEALRSKRQQHPMSEMLKRTPKGLETPNYVVLYDKPTWQVRQYDSFSVCSTTMDPQVPGPGAFNSLAGYIFGKNKANEKMAMTTPVISVGPIDGKQKKKMSFVMPSRFWKSSGDLSNAPPPIDRNSVVLETFDRVEDLLAVKWFGGFCEANVVKAMFEQLKIDLDADPQWRIKDATVDPIVLQYNDPFQPPWKRRNEVCLPVERRNR